MTVKVVTNLEEIGSIIGTFQGISEAAQDERFIQKILVEANERYLENFNKKAAAHAIAMGSLNRGISHMFEYGVSGLAKRGQPVTIADPTSPEARLWVFTSMPVGRSVETVMTFRDAVKPNYLPSQRTDLKRFKVPAEVIARMSTRRYVFRERAELVERGATVRPIAKDAEALIFPSRESGKGYGFHHKRLGPAVIRLNSEHGSNNGASRHKFAFTNYFLAQWEKDADTTIRISASNSIASRIGHAQRAREKEKAMKTPHSTNVKGKAAKSKKKSSSRMKKKVTTE